MEPPVLVAGPAAPVRAAPGAPACLQLPLPSGTPPFTYIWSRGGGVSLDDRFRTSADAGGVRLTVSAAQTDDSAIYTLQARNAAGSDTSKIRLEVSAEETPTGEDPPTFLRRLQDLTVKVGSRTRFLVEILSSTECKVTWYRNERRLLEAERVSLARDGNFWCADVAAVSVDDAGRWTCTAENDGGRASCSAHLNVLVPKAYKRPEFVEELRALLTEQGTVSLECKVVGVPTPVLRWFKDSREIKAGDVFALTANAEDPTSLGTYTCEAVNCIGRAYSSSKVHVVGRSSRAGSAQTTTSGMTPEPPPIFTKELEDAHVRVCEQLSLGCHVVVPPWPRTVVWYNKEGKVDPGERYHVVEDGVGGYAVEIRAAEWADEGEWKCVATSAGGRVGISTCLVTMDVPKNYRKPRFMENLQAVLTEEGLVSFECKVVGFPTPVLSWFKDGQELKPGDVYQLTGTNSLGSYCCIARNCMGQASSSAELTIEDIQNQLNEEEKLQLFSKNQAPKFIQGLKSVEAKIDEPFRFTVKVAIPPEPSVLWYRDDQPVDESARCHLDNEEKGLFILDIQNLEFLDQAEWKCVAMNDFGHSVTSCFLKLVIPRHYKKPRFLENLQAILSDEGAVNLECKVIGVPQPVLKWYKDGEELKPGDIHRIISGQDGTCCLGTYTCEAQNCMGIAASSASLLGFDDSMKAKPKKSEEQPLQRNLSLSTIHEERTSQMYDTPVGDITLDDKGEISFSFDGKEVSVSLYETPDLTEEEALQIVEMYADQLSENVTEQNVVELPPLRFVKETSTSGNLLMEAIIIDVSPDYFATPEEDLRTEADVEDLSIADDNGPPQLSLEQDIDIGGEDYLEKTMALLSDDKSDFPIKTSRKKSNSQRSGEDFFSLSHDQSLSEEKREDDTHISESELQSFASARSSTKMKSKSSKRSGEEGQESSEPTKTVVIKKDIANDQEPIKQLEQELEVAVPKPKRERRSSRGSRKSSTSSEKSIGKSKEELLRLKVDVEEVSKKIPMSDEEFSNIMSNMSTLLLKVIDEVQLIERDIILKSEQMSSAATASRSLEIISSVITPLSEIHSISDATKESLSELREITTTIFHSIPQPLKALQQSLTIIEKCIDMESDSKTLVKKTCVAIIETCGAEMQQVLSDITYITDKDFIKFDDKTVEYINYLANEMKTVIKLSTEKIKVRNLLTESNESQPEPPTLQIKHLRNTQKAVFELKSPLNSILRIVDSAERGKFIDLTSIKNNEVIMNHMSASIQDLQAALEQIESLSVNESSSSLPKYNTKIIEAVMDSVLKLRGSFEQLSTVSKSDEDKTVLEESLLRLKENLTEISTEIQNVDKSIGQFDVLQNDNKLDVLQKMAQILIALENNIPRLESMPEVKPHMDAFHKNLTKVLEKVIESNDANKYFTMMEICDTVNSINSSIKSLEPDNVLLMASLSNSFKIIQANFLKNIFESDLNCSIINNISELLIDIQEAINKTEETSLHIDSEYIQHLTTHENSDARVNIIIEQIDRTIASVNIINTIETTQELKSVLTPALQNVRPILEELKRSVAAVRASRVTEDEQVSEILEQSFAKAIATPLCELNQNIIVLNQLIVENLETIRESTEVFTAIAEPLHELHNTLEILQQDVISQYGEDLTPYDVSVNMASVVQNLQSCIVMVHEQAGVEGAEEMSTLEDISGIKTSADTLPSDRLVLPIAEETIVEQSLTSFKQDIAMTATAKTLQMLNEHVMVLQTPDIIEALDTLSEVSDYSDLKTIAVGLEELHTGIEGILHPLPIEDALYLENSANGLKLAAIAEPMQELQQNLSVIDTSDIPIYENILDLPTEKVHSVVQSIAEFKDCLEQCMGVVLPAMEIANDTIEISSKVSILREVCEKLKDIFEISKYNAPNDVTLSLEVKSLEPVVDSLIDATDVLTDIKIEEVKIITEELYSKVIEVQEDIIQFTSQSSEKLSQEAKLIQLISDVEANIAGLEQYEFIDIMRTSDVTNYESPQLAIEIDTESLSQIQDIAENAVYVLQDSYQEIPMADLMNVEEFFKTCKNKFTILRCLIRKASSHKKIIRLLQEFSSLQSLVDDFTTKRLELRLSDDVNECLSNFLVHANDSLKSARTTMAKVISSQNEMLIKNPIKQLEVIHHLKLFKQNKLGLNIAEIVKSLMDVAEVSKSLVNSLQDNILQELLHNNKITSLNSEEIVLAQKIEELEAIITEAPYFDDSISQNVFKKLKACLNKHNEYKDALGRGKTLIILKCLSECAAIINVECSEQTNEFEEDYIKDDEENALNEVSTEILQPMQALESLLINTSDQILAGTGEDSNSVGITSTESIMQTMTELHKDIIEQISLEKTLVSDKDISLNQEVDEETQNIQDSLNSIENFQATQSGEEITKPIKEKVESLHGVLSHGKGVIRKEELTKDINSNIDSMENALGRFIELEIDIAEISKLLDVHINESVQLAIHLKNNLSLSPEESSLSKAMELKNYNMFKLLSSLKKIDWLDIESYLKGKNTVEIEMLRRVFQIAYQLVAELHNYILENSISWGYQEEEKIELLHHIDEYYELIEIVEEISAIIQIDDAKSTFDIAQELKENICTFESVEKITPGINHKEIASNATEKQAKLALQLHKALNALLVQVNDSVQELAPALGADRLQQTVQVTTQLQANLIAVTGVQTEVTPDRITEITKHIDTTIRCEDDAKSKYSAVQKQEPSTSSAEEYDIIHNDCPKKKAPEAYEDSNQMIPQVLEVVENVKMCQKKSEDLVSEVPSQFINVSETEIPLTICEVQALQPKESMESKSSSIDANAEQLPGQKLDDIERNILALSENVETVDEFKAHTLKMKDNLMQHINEYVSEDIIDVFDTFSAIPGSQELRQSINIARELFDCLNTVASPEEVASDEIKGFEERKVELMQNLLTALSVINQQTLENLLEHLPSLNKDTIDKIVLVIENLKIDLQVAQQHIQDTLADSVQSNYDNLNMEITVKEQVLEDGTQELSYSELLQHDTLVDVKILETSDKNTETIKIMQANVKTELATESNSEFTGKQPAVLGDEVIKDTEPAQSDFEDTVEQAELTSLTAAIALQRDSAKDKAAEDFSVLTDGVKIESDSPKTITLDPAETGYVAYPEEHLTEEDSNANRNNIVAIEIINQIKEPVMIDSEEKEIEQVTQKAAIVLSEITSGMIFQNAEVKETIDLDNMIGRKTEQSERITSVYIPENQNLLEVDFVEGSIEIAEIVNEFNLNGNVIIEKSEIDNTETTQLFEEFLDSATIADKLIVSSKLTAMAVSELTVMEDITNLEDRNETIKTATQGIIDSLSSAITEEVNATEVLELNKNKDVKVIDITSGIETPVLREAGDNEISIEETVACKECCIQHDISTCDVHNDEEKVLLQQGSTMIEKISKALVYQKEHITLVQHIEDFISNEVTGIVNEISNIVKCENIKESLVIARKLRDSVIAIDHNATSVKAIPALEIEKNLQEQAQLAQILQDALSMLHTQALNSAEVKTHTLAPEALQKVSELISHLQEDLAKAIDSNISDKLIVDDMGEHGIIDDQYSMNQLETLLQDVTAKINLSFLDGADANTDSLRDTLDEVQTVIIKLKCDYDCTANDTLNESLEDLECSVRSVQLQINEESPPVLLTEACATLQLLVDNMNATHQVSPSTLLSEKTENILEKCSTEANETVQLLDLASKLDTQDASHLTSVVCKLNSIRDSLKFLRESFLVGTDTVIENGVKIVQCLDQMEENVFSLEREVEMAVTLSTDSRDSIITAVHSVYGSISNMRSTVSSVQKRYMFENYGKPSESLLHSIKNVGVITTYDVEENQQIWKKFSKSLRKVLNHFEDIKFYINFDKTARLPSDAAFTKIILEELKNIFSNNLVPRAMLIEPIVLQKVNNSLKIVEINLASIEAKSSLETQSKMPMFKELATEMLTTTNLIKEQLEKLSKQEETSSEEYMKYIETDKPLDSNKKLLQKELLIRKKQEYPTKSITNILQPLLSEVASVMAEGEIVEQGFNSASSLIKTEILLTEEKQSSQLELQTEHISSEVSKEVCAKSSEISTEIVAEQFVEQSLSSTSGMVISETLLPDEKQSSQFELQTNNIFSEVTEAKPPKEVCGKTSEISTEMVIEQYAEQSLPSTSALVISETLLPDKKQSSQLEQQIDNISSEFTEAEPSKEIYDKTSEISSGMVAEQIVEQSLPLTSGLVTTEILQPDVKQSSQLELLIDSTSSEVIEAGPSKEVYDNTSEISSGMVAEQIVEQNLPLTSALATSETLLPDVKQSSQLELLIDSTSSEVIEEKPSKEEYEKTGEISTEMLAEQIVEQRFPSVSGLLIVETLLPDEKQSSQLELQIDNISSAVSVTKPLKEVCGNTSVISSEMEVEQIVEQSLPSTSGMVTTEILQPDAKHSSQLELQIDNISSEVTESEPPNEVCVKTSEISTEMVAELIVEQSLSFTSDLVTTEILQPDVKQSSQLELLIDSTSSEVIEAEPSKEVYDNTSEISSGMVAEQIVEQNLPLTSALATSETLLPDVKQSSQLELLIDSTSSEVIEEKPSKEEYEKTGEISTEMLAEQIVEQRFPSTSGLLIVETLLPDEKQSSQLELQIDNISSAVSVTKPLKEVCGNISVISSEMAVEQIVEQTLPSTSGMITTEILQPDAKHSSQLELQIDNISSEVTESEPPNEVCVKTSEISTEMVAELIVEQSLSFTSDLVTTEILQPDVKQLSQLELLIDSTSSEVIEAKPSKEEYDKTSEISTEMLAEQRFPSTSGLVIVETLLPDEKQSSQLELQIDNISLAVSQTKPPKEVCGKTIEISSEIEAEQIVEQSLPSTSVMVTTEILQPDVNHSSQLELQKDNISSEVTESETPNEVCVKTGEISTEMVAEHIVEKSYPLHSDSVTTEILQSVVKQSSQLELVIDSTSSEVIEAKPSKVEYDKSSEISTEMVAEQIVEQSFPSTCGLVTTEILLPATTTSEKVIVVGLDKNKDMENSLLEAQEKAQKEKEESELQQRQEEKAVMAQEEVETVQSKKSRDEKSRAKKAKKEDVYTANREKAESALQKQEEEACKQKDKEEIELKEKQDMDNRLITKQTLDEKAQETELKDKQVKATRLIEEQELVVKAQKEKHIDTHTAEREKSKSALQTQEEEAGCLQKEKEEIKLKEKEDIENLLLTKQKLEDQKDKDEVELQQQPVEPVRLTQDQEDEALRLQKETKETELKQKPGMENRLLEEQDLVEITQKETDDAKLQQEQAILAQEEEETARLKKSRDENSRANKAKKEAGNTAESEKAESTLQKQKEEACSEKEKEENELREKQDMENRLLRKQKIDAEALKDKDEVQLHQQEVEKAGLATEREEEAVRIQKDKEETARKEKQVKATLLIEKQELAEKAQKEKHEPELQQKLVEQAVLAQEEEKTASVKKKRDEKTREKKAKRENAEVEAARIQKEKEQTKLKEIEDKKKHLIEEQELAEKEAERVKAEEEAARKQKEKERIKLKDNEDKKKRLIEEQELAEKEAERVKAEEVKAEEEAACILKEKEQIKLKDKEDKKKRLIEEQELAEKEAERVKAEEVKAEEEAARIQKEKEQTKLKKRLIEEQELAEKEAERVKAEEEAARIQKEKEQTKLKDKEVKKKRLIEEQELAEKEAERVKAEEVKADEEAARIQKEKEQTKLNDKEVKKKRLIEEQELGEKEAERVKAEEEAARIQKEKEQTKLKKRLIEEQELAEKEAERVKAEEEAARIQKEKEQTKLKDNEDKKKRLIEEQELAEKEAERVKAEEVKAEEEAACILKEKEQIKLKDKEDKKKRLIEEQELAEKEAERVKAEEVKADAEAACIQKEKEQTKLNDKEVKKKRLIEEQELAEKEAERVKADEEAARIQKEKEQTKLKDKEVKKKRLIEEQELAEKEAERVKAEEVKADEEAARIQKEKEQTKLNDKEVKKKRLIEEQELGEKEAERVKADEEVARIQKEKEQTKLNDKEDKKKRLIEEQELGEKEAERVKAEEEAARIQKEKEQTKLNDKEVKKKRLIEEQELAEKEAERVKADEEAARIQKEKEQTKLKDKEVKKKRLIEEQELAEKEAERVKAEEEAARIQKEKEQTKLKKRLIEEQELAEIAEKEKYEVELRQQQIEKAQLTQEREEEVVRIQKEKQTELKEMEDNKKRLIKEEELAERSKKDKHGTESQQKQVVQALFAQEEEETARLMKKREEKSRTKKARRGAADNAEREKAEFSLQKQEDEAVRIQKEKEETELKGKRQLTNQNLAGKAKKEKDDTELQHQQVEQARITADITSDKYRLENFDDRIRETSQKTLFMNLSSESNDPLKKNDYNQVTKNITKHTERLIKTEKEGSELYTSKNHSDTQVKKENGDIELKRKEEGSHEQHYIKEYQYEPSQSDRKLGARETPRFIDHNHRDYTMEFARPSGYREKCFEVEKHSDRLSLHEHLGKNAAIYRAQTIVLDAQLRSSAPPYPDVSRTPEPLERRSEIRHTKSKALSEARSVTNEKRAGLSRDLKRKPVFSTYLTDRTAVEGSRVKLTCSVLSSSDTSVSWYKNGVMLDNKLKYRTKILDGLITLEVLNTVPNDSAEYSCTIQNENGSVNSSANLKVYPSFEASPIPPTFTRSIRDTYHLAENELVLECRIRGQPLPTISWLKDDKSVSSNTRYQAYYLADGVCRLAIESPTPQDSGKYTCKAENSVWSDQITHIVNFTGRESRLSPNITTIEKTRFNRQATESRRPHFSNVLTDYKVVKGGTIGLQVEIRGAPTRVEWLREGASVTELYRNAKTFVEKELYTLALSDVTEKESGMYTCRAWGVQGNVDMNAAITVVQPNELNGKPAVIVGRPEKDILISVGEDINISFRVQGEPKPKVTFMKGIRDITTSQRVCKMTSDDYVMFTVKRSVLADAGTYCILARNAYGCDRAFITVVVRQRASSDNLVSDWTYPVDDSTLSVDNRKYKSVPERIPGEPSAVEGGNNWISLGWPKSEPGPIAPVLAYKVESWLLGKEGGARWVELGITPLNSFDTFNLKQAEEYHFRVTPRNRYGWGEPVQTSAPITVGLAGDRPEFTEILPGQLKVLVGESANLSCCIKGKPAPEVVWMKNGHEVEDEDRRISSSFNGFNCCLTIKDINIEDEARYSCEATNVHGRASTYARLAVVTDRSIWEADAKLKRERSADVEGDYPPQFTMRLRDRRVQATYPVRLTCQVIGSPDPALSWYKDGELLLPNDHRSFLQEDHFHTLEMAPTTLDDGGVYEALARNTSGAVSCRCSLVVDKGIRAYVAPEFCCGLEPLYRLADGEELRISAVVEAYPSVGVTWYRDGVRLRPSRRAIMTLDRDGQIELALAAVTPRDAGVYTCTASNEVGRATTSGKVEVIGDEVTRTPPVFLTPDTPYSKEPMFTRKPRSSEAREGDTVIIECEVVGDPKPDVYWLRDFLKPDYYRDSSHFKRVGAGPEYTFEIPHAKLDYTGAYSVVARNQHGEAKAVISLQILAKDLACSDETHNVRYGRVEVLPRFEKNLTDLLSCDGDAVEFECKVSGNPEPDIRWRHYNEVIRECPDFETSFVEGTARLKIRQVTADDEGSYTCEAANNLGKAKTSACLVVYPPGEPNTLSQRLRRPATFLSAVSTPRSTPRSTPARSLSRTRTPGPESRRLCSPARSQAPAFYTYPYNKVAEEGDTITLKCAIKGNPAPWATWDKDGTIITPSARISVKEKDDLMRVLEIEQVTVDDVGVYRITIENEFGRAEATARLEVITQKGKFHAGVRAVSPSPRKTHMYRSRRPSTPRLE